ncbi:MAG: cytochrome P450, partial [Acidobacteriota bacterium]|nr:cytochrome P450 [Acidobacteriota bacterium]
MRPQILTVQMAMMMSDFPPGPKSIIPGRHIFEMLRNSVDFLTESARRYGDIVHFKLGPQHIFLLNNPDYIKDILITNHDNFLKGRVLQRMKRLLGNGLLTSEKEVHRHQRHLIQPAFHRHRIDAYAQLMVSCAEKFQSESWRNDDTLDISQEMMRLTLMIVGKTLFGAETESIAEEVASSVITLVRLFNTLRMPYSEWFEKLPLPSLRRFDKARANLDSIIYAIISERRKEMFDNGDLLSMLLASQDGEAGVMND